jgi:hypothetical protein
MSLIGHVPRDKKNNFFMYTVSLLHPSNKQLHTGSWLSISLSALVPADAPSIFFSLSLVYTAEHRSTNGIMDAGQCRGGVRAAWLIRCGEAQAVRPPRNRRSCRPVSNL